MAWLPTWLFAALLFEALRMAHEPIRGGRQAAVVAIFGLLSFQYGNTLLQHIDLSLQILGVGLQAFYGLDGFSRSTCLSCWSW